MSSARSSVVSPGRRPASVSARRTQIRSVSWLMSSFSDIDSIAFHCDGYSSGARGPSSPHAHASLPGNGRDVSFVCHCSILSRGGAVTNPGAIQSGVATTVLVQADGWVLADPAIGEISLDGISYTVD